MKHYYILAMILIMSGCVTVTPTPKWDPVTDATEAEYHQYLAGGNGCITGQAFMTQRGGGVVKAAGRTVTIDPATSAGNEWWVKAGRSWSLRSITPPSPSFTKARRNTIADADGKFKFSGLAAGKYYVRTEVTWEVGNYSLQGGLVGQPVVVRDGQTSEIVLNSFTP